MANPNSIIGKPISFPILVQILLKELSTFYSEEYLIIEYAGPDIKVTFSDSMMGEYLIYDTVDKRIVEIHDNWNTVIKDAIASHSNPVQRFAPSLYGGLDYDD